MWLRTLRGESTQVAQMQPQGSRKREAGGQSSRRRQKQEVGMTRGRSPPKEGSGSYKLFGLRFPGKEVEAFRKKEALQHQDCKTVHGCVCEASKLVALLLWQQETNTRREQKSFSWPGLPSSPRSQPLFLLMGCACKFAAAGGPRTRQTQLDSMFTALFCGKSLWIGSFLFSQNYGGTLHHSSYNRERSLAWEPHPGLSVSVNRGLRPLIPFTEPNSPLRK